MRFQGELMNYRTPTKAIITDAGFASRYLPITKTIPKAMLPLGNRPIMQLVVEECVDAGITDIIIVATPDGKKIYELSKGVSIGINDDFVFSAGEKRIIGVIE